MKYFLSFALALGTLLAGCSGQQQPATPEQDAPETTQPAAPAQPEAPPAMPEEPESTDADAAAETAAMEAQEEATPAEEEAAPPAITVVDAAGLKEALAEHEGKVKVLNFWATWCPPCVEETPEFVEFYKETDRDQLAFISLSADDPAMKDKAVKAFQKNHGIPFPILILNEQNPDAFYEALGTEMSGALPTTLIYDRNGKVVEHWEGAVTLDDLKEATAPLLEEQT